MAKEEGVKTVVVGGKSDTKQEYCGTVGGGLRSRDPRRGCGSVLTDGARQASRRTTPPSTPRSRSACLSNVVRTRALTPSVDDPAEERLARAT